MSLLKEKPFLTPNDDGILGTDDAASIQNAIDAASEAGVNKVVIPRYNKRTDSMIWTVGATIRIPGNMHLVLDNCHLQLAPEFGGQMFANARAFEEAGKLIAGEDLNVRIQGKGDALLDGGLRSECSDPWAGALVYLHNVRNFSVEGFRVINRGSWGVCLMYCSYGKVSCLDFDGTQDDGVMLRCGCHDLTVENITGYTGNNVVAISAVVGKELEEPAHVMGHSIDVRDIIIKNVKATTRGGKSIVSLFNQDGAALYNILLAHISDISVPYTENRPLCAVKIGGKEPVNVREALPGETKNITISNLFTHAQYGVTVTGALTNSLMEGIHIHDDGEYALGVCPAQEGAVTTLNNLLLKGIYYNVDQKTSQGVELAKKEYVGEVLSLAACQGKKISIRDVMCGKVARLATVTGEIAVDITGAVIDELGDKLICADDKAKVTYKNVKVKGKVQK